MKLIITIDTEEDNWARYSRTDNPVENIERLIPLQALFDRYNARPTYLITYPVATNPRSVEILKAFLDAGKCEIGMHCHPWNTPPFEEEITNFNSILCNLPEELALKKLTTLHEAICRNFNIVPISFRAGRWGFGAAVARALCKLGYKIDTSVTPYVNWNEYQGPDFTNFQLHPHRFDPDDIATPHPEGVLLEVPATIGFLQKNFKRCQKMEKSLESISAKKLHLKWILSRVGLLNKVSLSPELDDAGTMARLARRLIKMQMPCINMFFHSTTLKAGLSPFCRSTGEEEKLIARIEGFLAFILEAKIQCETLGSCDTFVRNNFGDVAPNKVVAVRRCETWR